MRSVIFKTAIVVLLSFFLIACGGGIAGDAKNYVVVEDQTLISLNQVEISEVVLEAPAWVLIYESTGPQAVQGGASNIIGRKALDAGTYNAVSVSLERNIVNGETLYAELRKDAGTVGQFEPETHDTVITDTAVSSVSFMVFFSEEPYLKVGNGEVINNRLPVEKVITSQSSWIVVYSFDDSAENNLGSVLGIQKLDKGHHENVELMLTTGKSISLNNNDKIVVALHENISDTSVLDNFDADNDKLVYSQGEPAVQSLEVTIVTQQATCENCISFELGADPFGQYFTWSAVNTENQDLIADIDGSSNKNITLKVGQRYQFKNLSPKVHPLQLKNTSGDILLSQSSSDSASFADNTEVNFSNVSGAMMFTLTADLAAQLATYHCKTHGAMTGPFTILP